MVNWPEVTKFCGCCSLNTGIYIVGIIQAIGHIASAHFDARHLIRLLEYNQKIIGYGHSEVELSETRTNIDDEQIKLVLSLPQEDMMFLLQMYQLLLRNQIVTILCRMTVCVLIGVLFYGIHKNKPFLLKIYLIWNFPGWFMTTLNMAVTMFTYTWIEKFIGVLLAMLSAYQLLSVRSTYRQLTGKIKFYVEDENNTEISYPPTYASSNPPPYSAGYHNGTHCTTCSCGRTSTREESRPTPQEESIIFDQNHLVRHSMVIEEQDESPDTVASGTNVANSIVRRPTSLALINAMDCRSNEEAKKELEDAPVIYDEEQLNVGRSPIVETR